MTEETKTPLEQLKDLEAKKKKTLLLESLGEIKKLAKGILENKEKTRILLDELGISDKDQKSVIDWINSLPDVKLTENDKRKLAEKVEEKLEEKSLDINNNREDYPCIYTSTTTGYSDNGGLTLTSGPLSGTTVVNT